MERRVFSYTLYSASILPGMIPWFYDFIQSLTFLENYTQKKWKVTHSKCLGGAVSNYLTILFLILVLVGMVFNVETRISGAYWCHLLNDCNDLLFY